MEFNQFNGILQEHVKYMLQGNTKLFVANCDKDALWETYLNSFPPGTNEVYRQRREHDCSCCKNFVRAFGNVVAIVDNQVVTIWDFSTNNSTFQPVIDTLSAYVKQAPIVDVYVTKLPTIGTPASYEKDANDNVRTWNHFNVRLPQECVTRSSESEASLMAPFRDAKSVFQRSLNEISLDAIDTVLELIAQNSLYKGEEWQGALTQFRKLHKAYHGLPNDQKDAYCWSKSVETGGAITKIKNHSIGVLLTDISSGMDIDDAVRRYEAIVAPTNYKRPKAIFTKKMVEDAQNTLVALGLIDSLGRRHATLSDITINNILFANKDAAKRMSGDVFADLIGEAKTGVKQFDRVEEVQIERFINDILPTAKSVEAWIENRHESDLVSLIAPTVTGSPSLFKWDNGFSWAYNGNIADSMKQRVKAAGGNVEGILRFSLQWNTGSDNRNDYDAHCVEPKGNHIHYADKKNYRTTGVLDVDIVHPNHQEVAVENITWSDIKKMEEGVYIFYVNNFNHRGGRSGFSAEIEYGGQIWQYEYPHDLRHKEDVIVAKIKFSRLHGVQFIESLKSTTASKSIWGMQTNQFVPVSTVMFSPNYWDGQSGIGHRHYFFMLNGCKNEDAPNGFFNEFLREDFMKHKRVFEALGAKMKVEPTDDQLSGLGFSSTKRNSLVVKVESSFTRIIKLVF